MYDASTELIVCLDFGSDKNVIYNTIGKLILFTLLLLYVCVLLFTSRPRAKRQALS